VVVVAVTVVAVQAAEVAAEAMVVVADQVAGARAVRADHLVARPLIWNKYQPKPASGKREQLLFL
jgi:hypothetical protein